MEPASVDAQLAALTARVEALERRLADQWPPPSSSPGAPPGPMATPPPPPGPGALPPPPPPVGSTATPATRSTPTWITTENLLKWSGVGLVVLAAVFLVGTAIERGWIGPEVQLAGATLVGVALLASGWHLADHRRPWAVALAAGGATVLPVCAAATTAVLDLLDPYPALVVLVAVLTALLVHALVLSMEAVATVALIVTQPALLAITDAADAPALVPGLALVVLVGVAAGLDAGRGWPLTRIVGGGLAALALLALLASEGEGLTDGERPVAVAGVVGVAAIGWFGPLLGRHEPGRGPRSRWRWAIDHRVVVGMPMWTWLAGAFALGFDRDPSFGRTGVVTAAGFAAVAAVGPLRHWPTTLVAAQLTGAGALAAVALVTVIDGPGLLVTLAALASTSLLLAHLLDDRLLGLHGLTLGGIVAVWTGGLIASSLAEPRTAAELAATGLVVALSVLAAALAWRADRNGATNLVRALVAIAWVAVLAWMAGVVIHGPQGQVVVSLLWASAAVGGLVVGVMAGRQVFRILGLATLAVVLVKLLTVDLAEIDVLWRVGLFLVIGSGLLRVGYVLPRLVTRSQSGRKTEGSAGPS